MNTKTQNLAVNLVIISAIGIISYFMKEAINVQVFCAAIIMSLVMICVTATSKKYAICNFPIFLFWGFLIILTLWLPRIIANKNVDFQWLLDNVNLSLHTKSVIIELVVIIIISIIFIYISTLVRKWYLYGLISVLISCGICFFINYYLLRSELINNFQAIIAGIMGLYVVCFRDGMQREDMNIRTGISHMKIVSMIIIVNIYVGLIYAYSSDYINYIWNWKNIGQIMYIILFSWTSVAIKSLLLFFLYLPCNHKYIVKSEKNSITKVDLNEPINNNSKNACITLGFVLLMFELSWKLFNNIQYCCIGVVALAITSVIFSEFINGNSFLDMLCIPLIIVSLTYFSIGLFIWRYELIKYIFNNPIVFVMAAIMTAFGCYMLYESEEKISITIFGLLALMLVISYNVSVLPIICIAITTVFGTFISEKYASHIVYVIAVLVCAVSLNYISASGVKLEYICGDENMLDSIICVSPYASINKTEEIIFKWNDEDPIKVVGDSDYYLKTKKGTLSVLTINKIGEKKTQRFDFKSEDKYEGEYPPVELLQ